MNYLDPKNDFILRKLFGHHPQLLKSFLNAILPLQEGNFIESFEYLPVAKDLKSLQFNYSIVEVRCNDNQGRHFIVELLMNWTPGFMQTLLFDGPIAYIRQLDKPIKIDSLLPVYSINLVYDSFLPAKPEYYHHFQTVKYENISEEIEGFELVFIELLKFKASKIAGEKQQVLWLRLLTEIDESTTEVPAELMASTEIKEALENLKTSKFTKAELETYDKYWDGIRVERTLHSDYYNKGLAEGEVKGKSEGIIETANNGILAGFSNEIIKAMTKLTDDQIDELRREMKMKPI